MISVHFDNFDIFLVKFVSILVNMMILFLDHSWKLSFPYPYIFLLIIQSLVLYLNKYWLNFFGHFLGAYFKIVCVLTILITTWIKLMEVLGIIRHNLVGRFKIRSIIHCSEISQNLAYFALCILSLNHILNLFLSV